MMERITPDHVIRYHTKNVGIRTEDIGVAPTTIVSWMPHVVTAIAKRMGGKLSPHWLYGEHSPLYTAELDGHPISIAHIRVGAPATVMTLEELIACGARQIICLGYAGSLQPSAPIGSLIVPTACVSDEGTSRHYVEDIALLTADPQIVAELSHSAEQKRMKLHAGTVWTTDAPYREFVETIETHQQGRVLAVDMETSAVFALCHHRRVKAGVMLVVSDELWHEWTPAFGSPELDVAMNHAIDIVLSACNVLVHRKM